MEDEAQQELIPIEVEYSTNPPKKEQSRQNENKRKVAAKEEPPQERTSQKDRAHHQVMEIKNNDNDNLTNADNEEDNEIMYEAAVEYELETQSQTKLISV